MSTYSRIVIIIGIFLFLSEVANAQSKRYILLEHFTNTECTECKTKNEQFYNSILANNLADAIHIAYYAPYPSSSSFFHSQNASEYTAASNYYGISSTPQMVMNGKLLPEGENLIEQSAIDEFTATEPESPVIFDTFNLTDDGNGNYQLGIIIATEVAQPLGNYIIRTAVVESEVEYNAPNGETVHQNVVRKMLNNFSGQEFFAPTVGNSFLYSYTFTANADWNKDNLYIVSWIQNVENQEIINAASSKDFMSPLKSKITEFIPVSCFEGNDGGISVEVTDGVPPYTFLWSNGTTDQNLTNVPAGVYFLVVQDSAGDISEERASVTEPSELYITVEKEDEENELANGKASIKIMGGTPRLISNTPVYEIVWTYPDGSTVENVLNIQDLSSGLYFVKVTDNSGCSVSESISIFRNIGDLNCEIVLSEPLCFGDNNGSIVVTCFNATPPLIYNWSDGPQTPERLNMAAGTYTVIVSDAIGASFTKQMTLDDPAPLQNLMDIENETNDLNNGSACHNVTGGSPPYNITWTPVGSTDLCITNLSADNEAGGIINYSLIVEDSNGCDFEDSFSLLPISTELRISVLGVEGISCAGENDGLIEIFVSGGETLLEYDIDWANTTTGNPVDIPTSPSNTTILSGLSEGTYEVTVTDDNDEVVTETFVINEPSGFSIEIIKQDVCENGDGTAVNGFASVVANGGVPPYTYQWNNGTADSITNVSFSTNLTVTVLDANSCELQESIFVENVGLCVGIIDATLNQQFSLYPNIANNQINLSLNDYHIGQFTFAIVDITGRTQVEKAIKNYHANQVQTINIQQLSKGIYFGVIESEGKIARKRFVKM